MYSPSLLKTSLDPISRRPKHSSEVLCQTLESAGGSTRPHIQGLALVLLTNFRVLAKDTHGSTVRLAPPLVISQPELEQGLDAVAAALADLGRRPARALIRPAR